MNKYSKLTYRKTNLLYPQFFQKIEGNEFHAEERGKIPFTSPMLHSHYPAVHKDNVAAMLLIFYSFCLSIPMFRLHLLRHCHPRH